MNPNVDHPASSQTAFKYWTFISYSHQDKKVADWLHRALETYRLPSRLQTSHSGEIPNRLIPIFRDREELPSSADLTGVIAEALQQSRSLIVICSPRSAKSHWVNEEILTFKRLGRADRILSLIVDGEPNANDKPTLGLKECFPPGLRFQMNPDGTLSSEPTEPVAADLRPGKDGKTNSKLKLIAGILGIGFDQLKQRDTQRQQRRLMAITASSLAIMLVTIGLAVAAFVSRAEAVHQRGQAEINLVEAKRQEGIAKTNEAEAKRQEGIAKSNEAEAKRQEGIAKSNEAEAKRQEGIAKEHEKTAVAEKLVAQQQRYVAEMNLASRSFDEGEIGAVRELLKRQIPKTQTKEDLRSFEWHYLYRLCHRDLVTRGFKPFSPLAVASSPDGRLLAFAIKSENAVSVLLGSWDTEVKWKPLKGHTGHVACLAFSPDSKRLATASYDKTVKIWDVAEAAVIQTLKGHTEQLTSVAFSPDGKRIATGSLDHTVKLWNAETFELLHTFTGHKSSVKSVAFSPNQHRLASMGRDALKVWNSDTFEEIAQLKCPIQVDSGNVVFSPNGKRLVACSLNRSKEIVKVDDDEERPTDETAWNGEIGIVRMWDADTFEEAGTILAHRYNVTCVCFSADGKRLATGSWDKTIKLWDATTLKPITTFRGHTYYIWGLAFHSDCRRLVSAGGDFVMKIWDTDAVSETRSPDLTLTSPARKFSPPRTAAANPPRTHRMYPEDVTFSSDGNLIAAGIGGVKVWNTNTLQTISERGIRTILEPGNTMMTFSSDGKRLAHTQGNIVLVQDAKTLEVLKEFICFTQKTNSLNRWVGFNPNGTQLAASAGDNCIKVWDALTLEEVGALRGHATEIEGAAFSPNGKLLITIGDKFEPVRFWDMSRLEEVGSIKPLAGAFCVAFSTDGRRLAIGYATGTVGIYDPMTRRLVRELRGHRSYVQCLAFSPDGKRLATGGADLTIKFWDTATLDEVFTLRTDWEVRRLAFSTDSSHLATVGYEGMFQLWNGSDPTKEERAARLDRLKAELPAWHSERVKAYEKEGSEFAAEYHRQQIKKLEARQP